MEPTDLTIEILKSIRDEIRTSNERLERLERTTNDRFERLEGRFESLERRQTETEVRLATEIVAVANAIHTVKDLLASRLEVYDQVQKLETRVTAIEARLDA